MNHLPDAEVRAAAAHAESDDGALQQRAAYTTGLRQLAAILDAHPELPLPSFGQGASNPALAYVDDWQQDAKQVLAAWARAAGHAEKAVDGDWYKLDLTLAGFRLQVYSSRDAVCERVVTGTETVTIPAQPAVDAQPERVETREIVEWRCSPLLADDRAAAGASA